MTKWCSDLSSIYQHWSVFESVKTVSIIALLLETETMAFTIKPERFLKEISAIVH